MRGLRKHVGHAGREQLEALLVYEYADVARQAPRVAGHIDDAPRADALQQRQHLAGADAGWIEQHVAVGAAGPGCGAEIGACQVGGMKRRVGDVVPLRIGARTRNQRGLALDAGHARGATRHRQREVTQPAIQVEHCGLRVELQQLHDATHQ